MHFKYSTHCVIGVCLEFGGGSFVFFTFGFAREYLGLFGCGVSFSVCASI